MTGRLALVALAAVAQLAAPAAALDIEFDYSFDRSGFFAHPERRARLEAAARAYSAQLGSDLEAIPSGGWIAVFPDPEGGDLVSVESLHVPGDTVVVFVGARPMHGEERLALGGPGYSMAPCSELVTHWECLSETGVSLSTPDQQREWMFTHLFRGSRAAAQYRPTAFGTWGGWLSFASDADWYFGEDPDVPRGLYDFESAALHELGHVLGIGTAEAWGAAIPDASLESPRAVAAYGGPVPLEPDRAHWTDEVTGDDAGGEDAPLFTRGLPPGVRRRLSALDLAALRDVGWTAERLPVPEDPYAGPWLKGDVDGDGDVDYGDRHRIWELVFHEDRLALIDFEQADVWPAPHGDGVVDEADRNFLRRALRWHGRLRSDPSYLVTGVRPGAELVNSPFVALLGVTPEQIAEYLASLERQYPLPSTPEDFAAIRLLGFSFPDDPDNPAPGELFRGPPRGGDVNGDGEIDHSDASLLAPYLLYGLAGPELQPPSFAAADVAPFRNGNAVGDGVVDVADYAVFGFLNGIGDGDPDGDGLTVEEEDRLNARLWLPALGRPRHRPFERWTEECLPLTLRIESAFDQPIDADNPWGLDLDDLVQFSWALPFLESLLGGSGGGFAFLNLPAEWQEALERELETGAGRAYWSTVRSADRARGAVMEFCGRDGTPWSIATGVAPESLPEPFVAPAPASGGAEAAGDAPAATAHEGDDAVEETPLHEPEPNGAAQAGPDPRRREPGDDLRDETPSSGGFVASRPAKPSPPPNVSATTPLAALPAPEPPSPDEPSPLASVSRSGGSDERPLPSTARADAPPTADEVRPGASEDASDGWMQRVGVRVAEVLLSFMGALLEFLSRLRDWFA